MIRVKTVSILSLLYQNGNNTNTLKGKAILVKSVSEMKNLDKSFILMQI